VGARGGGLSARKVRRSRALHVRCDRVGRPLAREVATKAHNESPVSYASEDMYGLCAQPPSARCCAVKSRTAAWISSGLAPVQKRPSSRNA